MKNTGINLIFIFGILTILIPAGIFAQVSQGLTIYPKKILLDDNNNSTGWDPGTDASGNGITTFWIKEPNINDQDSIVIIEVHSAQPGSTDQPPSCGVDFITNDDYFEIRCINPPNDGSALHYLLIKH